MKKILLAFLAVVVSSLPIGSCDLQTQPPTTPVITLESTETFIPAATIKSTATFLPTFTPLPFELWTTPFPTPTLTPVPKDIFDNFQGLSGNCRTANALMPIRGEPYTLGTADATISFDRDGYSSGDPIKLSASANESYDQSKLMNGIVVKVIVEGPSLKQYSFYLYDDKTHGDEKASDGIYANAFDETLNTGIYKFYFQFSGRNKNTGERLAKECFLAKTINPILSPTTAIVSGNENKSCTKIEASVPVIVRPEGVGGNDSSEYGRLAFYPKAVSTGDSIIAIWQVGFDGQRPKPNVYMRLLDDKVAPIEGVKLLFERNIMGPTTLISKGNNAVFSYCGRYDISNYAEDRSTSAFLDSRGNLISEQVRSPSNIKCGIGPQSVWTGSRMLFYSWSNVFGQFGTFLDIADTEGTSISWRQVSTAFPVVGHGMVLTSSVTDWWTSLVIHSLDLEGNDLGELTALEALTYEVDEKIVVGKFRNAHIIPTDDGWMVVASLYSSGIYVAHLTPDGSLISNPFIIKTDLSFPDGFTDVLAYHDGAVIVGAGRFLFLSKDGIVIQEWNPKEAEKPFNVSLFEHRNRLFLIYTSKSTDEAPITNQVLVRELQCAP